MTTVALEKNTSVRIRNTGDEPYVDRHRGVDYVVPAGGEIIAPYAAARLWLGENSLRDRDTRHTPRGDEIHRVRVRTGMIYGREAPPLEVYDLDGTRITMLVDDFSGKSLPTEVTLNDSEAIENRIAEMERQINSLRKKRNTAQRKESAGTEAPEDGPSKVPVSG